jgi:hypothetical protein
VPQFHGVEVDKKGAIRWMKISNAGDWFQLEQTQQFPDALMGIECDLLSEGNQERLIASLLEMLALGHWFRYFAENIYAPTNLNCARRPGSEY